MKIKVPATSANLGPGFDSLGLALDRYLIVEVLEPSSEWLIEHELGDIPSDKTNLLVTTALKVADNLPSHKIKMTSQISLARGMGSSSSVIVAGIELANQLAKLNLTTQEKLRLATEIEGHPDNVAPAILGQFVVSSFADGELSTLVAPFPDCDLVAFIPNSELKTKESRGVLPLELPYAQAVAASSLANIAVAGLLTGDLAVAGRAMTADRFHQPYREQLVPDYAVIKDFAQKKGAYATYLSGAGPTIMTLWPTGQGQQCVKELESFNLDGQVVQLKVDTQGLVVEQ